MDDVKPPKSQIEIRLFYRIRRVGEQGGQPRRDNLGSAHFIADRFTMPSIIETYPRKIPVSWLRPYWRQSPSWAANGDAGSFAAVRCSASSDRFTPAR